MRAYLKQLAYISSLLIAITFSPEPATAIAQPGIKSSLIKLYEKLSPVKSLIASEPDSRYCGLTINAVLSNRMFSSLFPPLLVFLFGLSSCDASVMNPQPIAIRGPFFQGWLLRTVDHLNSRSFILIVGSFSGKKSESYDEHYIFCGVETKDQGTFQFEAFPAPDTVTVTGSTPSVPSAFSALRSSLSKNTNITWSAKDIGCFRFTDDECSADFKLGGSHIKFSTTNRMPWSKSNVYSAGPEGWLGYTSLLPCHYFVHSVGSECTYSLSLPSIGGNHRSSNECSLVAGETNCEIKSAGILRTTECTGNGYTHIEGNHGSFFPSGWVWSQAISFDNTASFSLTGGKFEIGAFAPITFILYVRIGDETNIFRTTGLDKIAYDVDGVVGSVRLTAYSFSMKNRIDLIIRPKTSISSGSFGAPLYIPTAEGFLNTPGCIETYTADADLTQYELDTATSTYIEKSHISLPLTALEFGGSFQGIRMESRQKFSHEKSLRKDQNLEYCA